MSNSASNASTAPNFLVSLVSTGGAGNRMGEVLYKGAMNYAKLMGIQGVQLSIEGIDTNAKELRDRKRQNPDLKDTVLGERYFKGLGAGNRLDDVGAAYEEISASLTNRVFDRSLVVAAIGSTAKTTGVGTLKKIIRDIVKAGALPLPVVIIPAVGESNDNSRRMAKELHDWLDANYIRSFRIRNAFGLNGKRTKPEAFAIINRAVAPIGALFSAIANPTDLDWADLHNEIFVGRGGLAVYHADLEYDRLFGSGDGTESGAMIMEPEELRRAVVQHAEMYDIDLENCSAVAFIHHDSCLSYAQQAVLEHACRVFVANLSPEGYEGVSAPQTKPYFRPVTFSVKPDTNGEEEASGGKVQRMVRVTVLYAERDPELPPDVLDRRLTAFSRHQEALESLVDEPGSGEVGSSSEMETASPEAAPTLALGPGPMLGPVMPSEGRIREAVEVPGPITEQRTSRVPEAVMSAVFDERPETASAAMAAPSLNGRRNGLSHVGTIVSAPLEEESVPAEVQPDRNAVKDVVIDNDAGIDTAEHPVPSRRPTVPPPAVQSERPVITSDQKSSSGMGRSEALTIRTLIQFVLALREGNPAAKEIAVAPLEDVIERFQIRVGTIVDAIRNERNARPNLDLANSVFGPLSDVTLHESWRPGLAQIVKDGLKDHLHFWRIDGALIDRHGSGVLTSMQQDLVKRQPVIISAFADPKVIGLYKTVLPHDSRGRLETEVAKMAMLDVVLGPFLETDFGALVPDQVNQETLNASGAGKKEPGFWGKLLQGRDKGNGGKK
jgi:hypothetical protein